VNLPRFNTGYEVLNIHPHSSPKGHGPGRRGTDVAARPTTDLSSSTRDRRPTWTIRCQLPLSAWSGPKVVVTDCGHLHVHVVHDHHGGVQRPAASPRSAVTCPTLANARAMLVRPPYSRTAQFGDLNQRPYFDNGRGVWALLISPPTGPGQRAGGLAGGLKAGATGKNAV
jgi:hypothetical protein